jgi:transposase
LKWPYTEVVMQPADAVEIKAKIKHIVVNREQLCWTALDLDHLIEENHAARAIWEMVERVDVLKFEEAVASWQGDGGRPCWPARVLMSVVLYGYSMGVASARELERLQKYEPGLRWLCADQVINHHTISDFRVRHEEALQDLFAQILGVLSEEGLVDLGTVMVDGTKVEAVAGKESYRRRGTLEKHVEEAREQLKRWRAQSEQERERQDERRQAARERAARERVERLEQALKRLQELEQESTTEKKRAELRVSETEAEARKMKFDNGGWDLAYNVQVSTEASHKMVVAVEVTTAANDLEQLEPAVDGVRSNCGILPKQVVADNGYATRDNVEKMEQAGVVLIAPWKADPSREAGACKTNGIELEFAGSKFAAHPDGDGLQCKAGRKLVQIGEHVHHGQKRVIYQAAEADCAACEWRTGCCGKRGGARRVERVAESEAMKKYLARMAEPATQEVYKKRKEVAEFPHLWRKAVLGLRRFLVRGPTKAKLEATWIAISYNIARWMCVQRNKLAVGMAAA